MKKVLLCLVFILGLGLPARAANFVEIHRDSNYLIYLDIDSVSERTTFGRSYIVAWTKWIPRGDYHKKLSKAYGAKYLDNLMKFYAYDKNLKQTQRLIVNAYDKKGNVIDSTSWHFSSVNFEEVVPLSYNELVYDLVIYTYQLD